MFIPSHLRHLRMDLKHRHCYWCSGGPHKVKTMRQYFEGPVRWYFCNYGCAAAWTEHRLDDDVRAWVCIPVGTRAKFLNGSMNAESTAAAKLGDRFAAARGILHLHLPMPEANRLP